MPKLSQRSWVEVSRSRLIENFRGVRAAAGNGTEILGVVKADAYGHGAVEVSRLLEAEGTQWFGVSNPREGVALRKAGIRSRILVMADFLPFEREALAWKATVLAVKDIPKDASVGYGAMFRAPRAMRIGVLAVGYADGYPHRLSNRGKVIAGGRFAQVLGAVSMDVTTIDLSGAPHIRPGDAVTLLGGEGDAALDAQQLARMAGTISYSVLCGINPRVKRVYVD